MKYFRLLSICFFFSTPLAGAVSWNAFFLTEPGQLQQIHTLLEPHSTVMSGLTATVAIADFNELAEVPVAELPNRLMEQDPRWDPYLRNLSSIFNISHQGRDGVLFYLPDTISVSLVQSILQKEGIQITALGTSSPVRSSIPFWLYSLLWGIFALVLVFQYRRRLFLAAFAGLLMFGLFLLSAGELFYQTTGLFFLFLEGLFALFKHFRLRAEGQSIPWRWNSRRSLTMGSALGFLLLLGVFQGLSLASWGLFLLGIGLSSGLLYIIVRMKTREVGALEHRLFRPLRLTKIRHRSSLVASLRPAAIFLLPLIPVMLFSGPLVSAPAWTGGGSLSDLRTHWEQDRHRSQPTASQYAAHMAYQDSFMYGGIYDFPSEGLLVTIRSYQKNGDKIIETQKPVITFNNDWFVKITSSRPPTALEKLFYRSAPPPGNSIAEGTPSASEGSLILPFLVLGALAFLGGRLAPPSVGSSWFQGLNFRREFLV